MSAATHQKKPVRPGSDSQEDPELAWFLDASSEVREAIRQRLDAYPEYKNWLQQFGPTLLRAVE